MATIPNYAAANPYAGDPAKYANATSASAAINAPSAQPSVATVASKSVHNWAPWLLGGLVLGGGLYLIFRE